MTLKGWSDENNVVVGRHAHARTVTLDAPNRADLFRLDDYVVSGVIAGTIWLIRRQQFTDAERRIRGNIRNACCGQSVMQLENMMLDRDGFDRDCIEEFKMEVEAEGR